MKEKLERQKLWKHFPSVCRRLPESSPLITQISQNTFKKDSWYSCRQEKLFSTLISKSFFMQRELLLWNLLWETWFSASIFSEIVNKPLWTLCSEKESQSWSCKEIYTSCESFGSLVTLNKNKYSRNLDIKNAKAASYKTESSYLTKSFQSTFFFFTCHIDKYFVKLSTCMFEHNFQFIRTMVFSTCQHLNTLLAKPATPQK